MSINGQISRICSIHTTDYFFSDKRNEALIHTMTWMDLENIRLIERSQSQKSR